MIESIYQSKPSSILTIHLLMDMDHDDAFKLIEDVPNCLIWTSIAQNFFGLFPNMEWNTFYRALVL